MPHEGPVALHSLDDVLDLRMVWGQDDGQLLLEARGRGFDASALELRYRFSDNVCDFLFVR
jgi:hypothetical protein